MIGDREICYRILADVEDGAFSNLAVGKALEKTPAYSAAFVRELVYGVLRNALLLDANALRFCRSPRLGTPEKLLLRMGIYQIVYMDSVADHAAVNETVALARRFAKGREGFINAVLRSFLRDGGRLRLPETKDPAEQLSIRYSASPDLVRFLLNAYGSERTEQTLRYSVCAPSLALRVNTRKTDASALAEILRSEGVETKNAALHPQALIAGGPVISTKAWRQGLFSVQGECSQRAVERLSPKPGDLVLDLCAAPGGKACAAAELMDDRGSVRAFELYESRTALIRKEAARLGLSCISAETQDAAVFLPEFEGKADCVIADVPCSGLGTIAKKPEIKLRSFAGPDPALCELQQRILRNAGAYLAPGGRLLYSTCTLDPAENGDQVRRFLNENTSFRFESEETIFPSERQSDGFYIALIRRSNDQRRL